jgi:hypothetical protein
LLLSRKLFDLLIIIPRTATHYCCPEELFSAGAFAIRPASVLPKSAASGRPPVIQADFCPGSFWGTLQMTDFCLPSCRTAVRVIIKKMLAEKYRNLILYFFVQFLKEFLNIILCKGG